MVAVVAFSFMIVVSHEPLAIKYVDQRILVSMWGGGRLGNLIGFHLHDSSKFVHILGVEDEPSFWHRVYDTIMKPCVKWRAIAFEGPKRREPIMTLVESEAIRSEECGLRGTMGKNGLYSCRIIPMTT